MACASVCNSGLMGPPVLFRVRTSGLGYSTVQFNEDDYISLLHPFDSVQGLASAAGLDGTVGKVRVHSFLPNPCFYGTAGTGLCQDHCRITSAARGVRATICCDLT